MLSYVQRKCQAAIYIGLYMLEGEDFAKFVQYVGVRPQHSLCTLNRPMRSADLEVHVC